MRRTAQNRMVDYEIHPVDQPSTYGLFSDVRRACDAWFRRREAQEGIAKFKPFQGWTMPPKSDYTPPPAPARKARPKMTDAERKAKINLWRLNNAARVKAQTAARNRRAYAQMTPEQKAAKIEETKRWRAKNREVYNASQRELARKKLASMTPEERRALYDKQAESRRKRKEAAREQRS